MGLFFLLIAMATQISKKRKFVADGVFKAELNEFLMRELAEDGYSGVEVRVTPLRTEIIILATRTQNVLGEKGRRIRELTSVVQKRFNFPDGTVELYAEKVAFRGLCAIAQCESLRYKLLAGAPVRKACYGVVRFIMESGAKGCEVVVSRIHRYGSPSCLLETGCDRYQGENHVAMGSNRKDGTKETITRSRFDCGTERRSSNQRTVIRTERRETRSRTTSRSSTCSCNVNAVIENLSSMYNSL